jgi:hypothetical protein
MVTIRFRFLMVVSMVGCCGLLTVRQIFGSGRQLDRGPGSTLRRVPVHPTKGLDPDVGVCHAGWYDTTPSAHRPRHCPGAVHL